MIKGIKNSALALAVTGFFISNIVSVSAAYFDNAPAPACGIQITGSLSQGSTNPEVYILQGFLKQSGYLNAIPNGTFGAQTKLAVKSFQRDNGIQPTGSVGPATRNAINERICDSDQSVLGDDYGYSGYSGYSGYQTGVTYVAPNDPYVKVITPQTSNPAIYSNPGTSYVSSTYQSTPPYTSIPSYAPPVVNSNSSVFSQGGSANIIYSSAIGYTYGLTPQPGSLTINNPQANTSYREGDTVYLSWTTNNLTSNNQFQIILESVNANQNKVVSVTSGNSASFTLTKELLDSICSGTCDYNYNSQNAQYKVVLATPITDISGQSSIFRASVPINVTRPFSYNGTATISPNKTPVNSGEVFRLYVNTPANLNNSNYLYPTLTFRLRAICPSNVTVSIAGAQCGSEFTLPYTYSNNQQEVPVTINNAGYYPQKVTFEIVTYNGGVEVSKSQTEVSVNGLSFSY
ncbi:MAG: putative peptidoglycan binding domain protein [Candidatus Nomurabacteria bacterium]|nr:putative peptidoglycan binding domain protein [Candidatus Nomurabacteria bacterium]